MGSTKRLAPKLSRVEIDVDYSSLLRPAITHREQIFSPSTELQLHSSNTCQITSTEDSSGTDTFSLRLRGGMELCAAAAAHAESPSARRACE